MKAKQNTLLTILLCFAGLSLSAQQRSKNSVYIELGGNGIIYSVNYDRLIVLSEQFKLAPRAGIAVLPKSDELDFGQMVIPMELNALWAKSSDSKNHLEVGIGLNLLQVHVITPSNPGEARFAKVGTGRVGLRHQKPTGGLMYRVGVTLPFAQDDLAKFARLKRNYFGGISIGYSF